VALQFVQHIIQESHSLAEDNKLNTTWEVIQAEMSSTKATE
jgi:hypothetical protein